MIERLLAAERALANGDIDLAHRLFEQVADADPRNAIAVVGLGEVAERRGRTEDASRLAARALEIDPDDAAAQRLLARLEPVPVMPTGLVGTKPAAVRSDPPLPAPERRRFSLLAWLRRLFRRGS